jgi:pimeloyl-ACP methyl ester carboxylesterase
LVLVGGSGPSDRHNDGFFDALRAHLASTGVAVLAYDKRGTGKSTGARAAATVEDLAHDAAAAVAALQGPPQGHGRRGRDPGATVKAGGLPCACARSWARRGTWS